MEITWKEPPADRRRASRTSPHDLDAFAQALKNNPGQWALARTATISSTTKSYKKRGLETQLRKVSDKHDPKIRYDVYARWPETEAAQ